MSKYWAVMKIGWQNAMAYRVNFIISSVLNILRFVAEVVFWSIFFDVTKSNVISNYTINSMITYYALMFLIGTMMDMGEVGGRVANDIRNGTLNQYTVKPLSYFGYQFSEILSRKLLELIITVAAFVPIFLLYVNSITISMDRKYSWLILGIVALSVVLNFFVNVVISLAAFWFKELTSFFFLKNILLSLLSGGMFPIDLFPSPIVRVMDLLPFKYIIFFPINVLMKGIGAKDLVRGICIQLFWIAALYLSAKWLWKKGIRHFEGTGI